ncbi:MAG: nucleoside-diphosphate-sugar epimerase [Chitinophagales bacterium]|jgi:nucleoside-diphosphate-sugar epimerase
MSDKLKIVLTGGNGFLGSHLVDRLLLENTEVHCIVRESSNLKWLNGKNIHIHTCGLKDIDAMSKVFENVDYIFHLAGVVAALSYEDYYYGNVELTKNLLEAALPHKEGLKKIVVTSSLAVGGPCTKETPIDETGGFNAISLYGKAKVEQEQLCAQYYNRLPITIARPSVISGEREVELFEFIKTVNQGLVPLVGSEDKYVGIVNVKDLTEGFYQMALSSNTAGEAYYMSSEEVISWKELGEICANKLGNKPLYLHLPHFVIRSAGAIAGFFGKLSGKAPTFDVEKAKEGVESAWICKVNKAKSDFGFVQTVSIKDGVEQAIDWYKENNWL